MTRPSFKLSALVASTALVASLVACANGDQLFTDRPTADGGAGQGGQGGQTAPTAKAESVDLLLVVDNSGSMADKQQVLGLAVPDLIESLVNPVCIDQADLPVPTQPGSAAEDCPEGSRRMFPPVTDIHVGVITTSLGGHGADACAAVTQNDRGRFIARTEGGDKLDTYAGLGYLAWDPDESASPPGESDLGKLEADLETIVLGAGQEGCGYEATLESWYRFLVEPEPHQDIDVVEGQAVLTGVDDLLLEQRKAFLRPDSLLLILALSDENDCSIRDGGQFYFAAQLYEPGTNTPYRLPRARAACALDPNDPCCASCGQPPKDGCSDVSDDCSLPLPPLEDHVNLRCWQQKRRFGIDFMWPLDRYRDGLTASLIADRTGELVKNPIFSDLDPGDARSNIRDPRLVFFGTLTGVPWQDIARQSSSKKPDLVNGLDAQGRTRGAFQTAAEMAANGTWKLILGDPTRYFTEPSALPQDPLMVESVNPRSGAQPITGDPIAPPDADYDANTINGHEYEIPGRGDLQYACIFELPTPRDCSLPTATSCDCATPDDHNPLCQKRDQSYSTLQGRAKAYPGLRQLDLAKRLEVQAAVGSVCPAQLDAPEAPDFGYRPFARTLMQSIQPLLD